MAPRRQAAIAGHVEPEQGDDVAGVQAEVEGVVVRTTVDWQGASFRLADQIPAMVQLKFANAAARGIGADDVEGLSALYMMIRACVYRGSGGPKPGEDGHDPKTWDAGDFTKFEDVADESCADNDELLEFVTEALGIINSRPTVPRSGSSSPARRTSQRSRGGSSSRAPRGADELTDVTELIAR